MTSGDNPLPSKRSWVVGSSLDCDLVVDHPGVSKKHCRLHSDGAAFTLEDLASTNGTFLNDVRVVGAVEVKPTDSVRLGGVVEMPWPTQAPQASGASFTSGQPLSAAANLQGTTADPPRRVISIGAMPDNDYVITDPTVSGHHAQLFLQGETWVLEDLGSTNGTFVKSNQERITRAFVRRSDAVFFGSKRITISQCIAEAASGSRGSSRRRTGTGTTKAKPTFARNPAEASAYPRRSTWVKYLVAACVPVLIYGGYQLSGTWAAREDVGVDLSVETARANGSEVGGNAELIAAKSIGDQREAALGERSGMATRGESDQRTKPLVPQSIDEAVFILAVESKNESGDTPANRYRIATAWSVRGNLLITTAHAVEIIENQVDRNLFPKTMVFAAKGGQPIEVDRTGLNRSYAEAKKQFDAAAALVGQLEATTGIGTEDVSVPEGTDVDAIVKQYQRAYKEASVAYQAMKASNVGWIRLKTEIDNPMLVNVSKANRLRPKQSIELVGSAFDADDPYLDSLAFRISRHKGALATPQAFESAGAINNLWIVDSPSDWTAINADGCLVVDPRAPTTAIGMFSKAIPGANERSEQGFAIVEANVIADLLNEI